MKLISKLSGNWNYKIHQESVVEILENNSSKKNVLVSYISGSISKKWKDKYFYGHSNKWESKKIVETFLLLGYRVDVINWDDNSVVIEKKYDVIFDIHTNIIKLNINNPKAIKILHLTGSDPFYQNDAEKNRVKKYEKRTKSKGFYERVILDPDMVHESIKQSTFCTLLGNKNTLNTYPKKFHNKIHLIPVTSSDSYIKKTKKKIVTQNKEFLWFFGSGVIHKGLDLVLEAFNNTQYTLNIIGQINNSSFVDTYKEVLKKKNIIYHGYIYPNSSKFKKIVDKCFCFIAPSCSEATSTAVVTAMKVGMVPIVSKDVGVDLPEGCGIILKEVSIKSIRKAIISCFNLTNKQIYDQITNVQKTIINTYSRKNFEKEIKKVFKEYNI